MFSQRKNLGKGTLVLGLLLTACSSGAAGGASAAPVSSGSLAGSAGSTVVDEGPVAGASFDDGYQLGVRNGSLLVNRLRQRTVGAEGCAAVGDLERALLKVTRTVRPPASASNDELVAGFYSGYVDATRSALADVRAGCGEAAYSSGEFAGQLYGAVACQVATVSLTAVSTLQLAPLYDGWSGGSSDVQTTCRTSLQATLESCTSDAGTVDELLATLQVSCTDTQ